MFLLAQVAVTVSPWTPELIVALFAGVTGIIGAVTTLIISLVKAKKEMREEIADNKKVVREVHDFVNGSNTKLLQEVARLSSMVAQLTGKKDDATASDIAHVAVFDKLQTDEEALVKRERIAEAGAKAEQPKAEA